ncbi:hypothetical protein ACO0K1_19000 [Undibacterium sp. SXout20W]
MFVFCVHWGLAVADDELVLHDHIRGSRYCEILVVNGSMSNLVATVYNTLGVNDCPANQWSAIDPKALKKELRAKAIEMNGPRYFLMDKIGQSNVAPPVTILGGLGFKERASVQIPIATMLRGKSKPYEETTVKRSTEYVYSKGSIVYELISTEHTYVMQTYAQIIDPKLTEADLSQLNGRLKLPEGWKFNVFTLDEDLVLKTVSDREAHVTQDDLLNTYQRMR